MVAARVSKGAAEARLKGKDRIKQIKVKTSMMPSAQRKFALGKVLTWTSANFE